jgi:TctA family transporter
LGTYAIRFSEFDVILAMVFGGLGYFFQRTGFPPAALLLGFILGPMLEENLRRAMLLSRGDPIPILTAPLSGCILFISALLILSSIMAGIKKYRNKTRSVSVRN